MMFYPYKNSVIIFKVILSGAVCKVIFCHTGCSEAKAGIIETSCFVPAGSPRGCTTGIS
jgi:hypothetical protein